MKLQILFIVLVVGSLSTQAVKGDESLDQQLQSLNLPSNEAPANISNEKLYSVQSRYGSVRDRSEFSLGFGKNFSGDSFVTSAQINGGYRFYLNDKWHFALSGSYVSNTLSDAGQRLLAMNQLVPDVAYVKYRAAALANYNLFYGKFRLSMDQVFYFDQYLALGPGIVGLSSGTATAAVGDVGFIFWAGRKFNAQFGLKDYYYNQKRVLSSSNVHDLVGHFEIGMLLGEGR